MKKLRSIFGVKVKSQLSAWTTFAAECAEGFVRKVKSQLSAWMTSAAECAEVLEERICSLVHSFGLLRRSVAECVDQNCVVVKS